MSDVIYYQTAKPRKHLVIASYLIEPHRRHTQRELFVLEIVASYRLKLPYIKLAGKDKANINIEDKC